MTDAIKNAITVLESCKRILSGRVKFWRHCDQIDQSLTELKAPQPDGEALEAIKNRAVATIGTMHGMSHMKAAERAIELFASEALSAPRVDVGSAQEAWQKYREYAQGNADEMCCHQSFMAGWNATPPVNIAELKLSLIQEFFGTINPEDHHEKHEADLVCNVIDHLKQRGIIG